MHYFKLLLGILLIASSSSFAMQEHKETEFTYPAGQSPLEQLPTDVKGIILYHLVDSSENDMKNMLKNMNGRKISSKEYDKYMKDSYNSRTKSIKNIRNFMSASKTLRNLASSPTINGNLIQYLQKKYPLLDGSYSNLNMAIELGTDAACQWIRNKIPQDEALDKTSYLFNCGFTRHSLKVLSFLLKAFPTNIYQPDRYGCRILDRTVSQVSDFVLPDNPQKKSELQILDLIMQTEHDLIEKSNSPTKYTRVIDLPNKNGDTAVMRAIRSGNCSLIDKLLTYKPDIYARNNHGQNLLHIYPYYMNKDYRCEKFDRDCGSNTYICCPEKEAWIKTRQQLLDFIHKQDLKHILINQADNDGNTPLIAATHPLVKNHRVSRHDFPLDDLNCLKVELMKQLIEHGADVTCKNKNGENFINYLIKYDVSFPSGLSPSGLSELLSLIPQQLRNQVINEPDHEGKTALEVALEKTNEKDENTRTSAKKWVELLWKYNPENKWQLYRKYHPIKFYTAAVGAAAGTGAAAYFGLNFLSKYLPNNSSS